MMELCFVLLSILVHQSCAVIYKLDDAEYKRMPAINHLDDYDACLQDPDALYCTAKLKLVSDEPNELMDLITNYSAWDLKHFDHSKLYRGVCVTKTCKMNKREITMNLNNSLESCINESIWKQYRLKAKLLTQPSCYSTDRKMKLDYLDIIVGTICFLIIIVNVVATLYDVYEYKKPDTKGMDILLSFSIIRNWSRLQQNHYRIKHPVERLKAMDGIRSIIMIHFVFGHALVPLITTVENHHEFENMYSNISFHILINGPLVVQAYFVMAGILLSYKITRASEMYKMTWRDMITNIFKRWLRLSPSFIICLLFISTWMRHLGSGPLWQQVGAPEVEDCRRYWMWNFFFLTNYKTGSHCMPHSWYLAADMHLFCFGVAIFVLVTSQFWRKVILVSAFVVGTVSTGIVTYKYNIRSFLEVKPIALMNTFVDDPNFDYLYKPTHTNMPAYVIGLGTGLLIYRLQKNQLNIQKIKKFSIPFVMLLPSNYALLMLGSIHYEDGPPFPLYVRILYQMMVRPVMAIIYAVVIIGLVFKVEDVIRSVLEWEGWIWPARVSYTTYVTQFAVMRLMVGNSKTLFTFSKSLFLQAGFITVVSFIVGAIVWLLLDGPVSHIIKICMETPPKVNEDAKEK